MTSYWYASMVMAVNTEVYTCLFLLWPIASVIYTSLYIHIYIYIMTHFDGSLMQLHHFHLCVNLRCYHATFIWYSCYRTVLIFPWHCNAINNFCVHSFSNNVNNTDSFIHTIVMMNRSLYILRHATILHRLANLYWNKD